MSTVSWSDAKRRAEETRRAAGHHIRTDAERAAAQRRLDDEIRAYRLAEVRRSRTLTQREVAEAMPAVARPPRAARVAALRALPVHWEPDAEEIQLAYIDAQVCGYSPECTYEHVWTTAHVLASSEALRHLTQDPAVARALRIWCLVTADRVADAAVPAVARG